MDQLLERVKERVKERGMTSGEFSRETGIPAATVHYLFHKGKRPTLATVQVLEKWLGDFAKPESPPPEEWKRKVVSTLKHQRKQIAEIDSRLVKLEGLSSDQT